MKYKKCILYSFFGFAILFLISFSGCQEKSPDELPNILWLTSEDNSPFLGCYGDEFATTPNLDKLASEGFLYTHAYANAPVCAPARNTIITGVYACSNGNQHMRSYYLKSELIKTYPEFLRQVGYYCTNNTKTDYNTNSIDPNEIWDDSNPKAHYKNRAPGQPFFAVFNSIISHESSIHKFIPNEDLRHSPEEVPNPPYHPATPEMKHDWAQYYDKVEDMDTWVGEKLKELEDEGLADNTIVFYYADHGGVLARSKRFVYETGTRVPFIVRIPEKYKYLFPSKETDSKVDRLISFVDLAPTLLSIARLPIPGYMQGSAFLGEQKTEDPENVFIFRDRIGERYDMSRAVRGKRFRYIRNYLPYRTYGQHSEYSFRAPSIRSWEQAYLSKECNKIQSVFWNTKPVEELYDAENDPWEVKNLAGDPAYKKVIENMRLTYSEWTRRIFDTGFIPEADLIDRLGDTPAYDYMRSEKINLDEIIKAADIAIIGETGNLKKLQTYLKSDESAIRYWGVTGLLILGKNAFPALNDLKASLEDESDDVVIVAAEALYNLGEKEDAKKALIDVLKSPNKFACCRALNTVDCLGIESSPELVKGMVSMLKSRELTSRDRWSLIAGAKWLFEKWGLNPNDYDLQFNQ